MNTKITPAFFVICSLFSGCLKNSDAPERLCTADSYEKIKALREVVQRVSLVGKDLRDFPPELTEAPRLEVLHMRRTSITNFVGLEAVTSLRELDFSENIMHAAPHEIASLTNLAHLYLSDCSLKKFPEFLSQSDSLTYLNLDRNQLTSLPQKLPTHLRWLRLNSNQLTSLPDSIGDLASLQRLYLDHNKLNSLPDSISSLSRLEDISLVGNRLTAFPSALTNLTSLRNLDLSGNSGITTCPPEIAAMTGLRTLTLVGCKIPKEESSRIRAALPACLIIF